MQSKENESGNSVIVKHGNIEGALRKFKRKLKDDNFIIDVKKNLYYVKPSALKREAKNKQKRRTAFKQKILNQTEKIF